MQSKCLVILDIESVPTIFVAQDRDCNVVLHLVLHLDALDLSGSPARTERQKNIPRDALLHGYLSSRILIVAGEWVESQLRNSRQFLHLRCHLPASGAR